MSPAKIAHIALITVSTIYGLNYIIARGVMVGEFIPPNVFILLRVFVAAILFFLFHRSGSQFTKKEHVRLAFCGLTGVAINQLFFFNGLKLSGPIQASLVMTTTPILIYFLSLIFLNTNFYWHKIVGIGFGLTGASLIIYQSDANQSFENATLGNIMIFINAVSFSTYLILVKNLMVKYPPEQVLKWVFLYGLIFILPFSIHQIDEISLRTADWKIYSGIAYVLLLTTYVAYRLNGFALSKVNPTLVGVYIYLQPLIAAMLSIMLGVESLDWKKGSASVLILVSILLVSLNRRPFSRVKT